MIVPLTLADFLERAEHEAVLDLDVLERLVQLRIDQRDGRP